MLFVSLHRSCVILCLLLGRFKDLDNDFWRNNLVMEFLEKCAKCCVYSIGGALFPRFCFVSSLSFQKKKILREEAQQPGASKGMSVMYSVSFWDLDYWYFVKIHHSRVERFVHFHCLFCISHWILNIYEYYWTKSLDHEF